MGTTADKLAYLLETKEAIKEAIKAKGVNVAGNDTFRSYADKIEVIDTRIDENLPVKYYDYDGSLLYSYTQEEFELMQEHPELPNHEGLTSVKWCTPMETMKSFLAEFGIVHTGACYVPNDNKTRLYVSLDDRTDIGIYIRGNVTVEWGDGQVSTINSENQYVTVSHTYIQTGDYVIRIAGSRYSLGEGTKDLIYLKEYEGSSNNDRPYDPYLRKIELSNDVAGVYINAHSALDTIIFPASYQGLFSPLIWRCPALSSLVNVPASRNVNISECYNLRLLVTDSLGALPELTYCDGLTELLGHPDVSMAPRFCKALKRVVGQRYKYNTSNFPTMTGCSSLMHIIAWGAAYMFENALLDCESLRRIEGLTSLRGLAKRTFSGCRSLSQEIVLEDSITYIPESAFLNCQLIPKVTALGNITSIGANAFFNCINMTLDLSNNTQVASADNGLYVPNKVIVPDALYDEWIADKKWSPYASRIVRSSEYNG